MVKQNKQYKFNYIYNKEVNAKRLDEILERLFTKYLIEYE